MKEPPQEPRRRAQPAEGRVPGAIPEGPHDTRLEAGGPPREREHACGLPQGAWLAVRKSGGLLFSSREVAVYPDGRVTATAIGGGGPAHAAAPRRLTEAQLAALRRALEGIDFGRLPAPAGRQRPDAYAYEIVVRSGRAAHAVEVFDGSIPQPLAPLIRQFNHLLSRED